MTTPNALLGKPAAEARTIMLTESFARSGDKLYIYRNGRYVDANPILDILVINHLTEARWTPSLDLSVRRALLQLAPPLPDEPSLNLVNFKNGLYDIRTGALMPHTPSYLTTIQIEANYNPTMLCPATDQFYSDIFAPDIIPTIYEIVGWLMFPDTNFHKALMLVGGGANGKSTFIRHLATLLGQSNVASETLQSLNTRNGPYSLLGKLVNLQADNPAIPLQDNHTFNAIVAGDMMTIEQKYLPRQNVKLFCRLVYACNSIPQTADNSYAYARRWLTIPFNRVFKETDPKTLNPDVLHSILTMPGELSGLVNKALAGYKALRLRGHFAATPSLIDGSQLMSESSNPILDFLTQAVTLTDPLAVTPRSALWLHYVDYCTINRMVKDMLGRNTFFDMIEKTPGITRIIRTGITSFKGIKPVTFITI